MCERPGRTVPPRSRRRVLKVDTVEDCLRLDGKRVDIFTSPASRAAVDRDDLESGAGGCARRTRSGERTDLRGARVERRNPAVAAASAVTRPCCTSSRSWCGRLRAWARVDAKTRPPATEGHRACRPLVLCSRSSRRPDERVGRKAARSSSARAPVDCAGRGCPRRTGRLRPRVGYAPSRARRRSRGRAREDRPALRALVCRERIARVGVPETSCADATRSCRF